MTTHWFWVFSMSLMLRRQQLWVGNIVWNYYNHTGRQLSAHQWLTKQRLNMYRESFFLGLIEGRQCPWQGLLGMTTHWFWVFSMSLMLRWQQLWVGNIVWNYYNHTGRQLSAHQWLTKQRLFFKKIILWLLLSRRLRILSLLVVQDSST